MISLLNGFDSNGVMIQEWHIQSEHQLQLDITGLTILPSLIDPHVHFRVPGSEYKEDWRTGAQAAINGGITQVCDMPNNQPACTTSERLEEKRNLIDAQLSQIDIPLRYGLYFGADKRHLNEIPKVKDQVVGIKIFMGCSTGDLLIDDDQSLAEVFRIAAEQDMLVAVHAEDEHRLCERKKIYGTETNPAVHSLIRDRQAAVIATNKAIDLAKKYGTRLYILHMSTKEEVESVRQAKKEGVKVFAEACSHHLFLTEDAYARWGTKVQMNPPLRTQDDQNALWRAIHEGVIDTIGTDHAPHTLQEKLQPYGKAPSGIPGIETLLPLLLNAVHQQRLSLDQMVRLTRTNIQQLFGFPNNDDVVLVDLKKTQTVNEATLKSKCGWSPFHGTSLTGWPIYTILKGRVYPLISC